MNTCKMSAIQKEHQNTSPDYWRNCQDFHNIRVQSPDLPDKNIEFVYLPKNTQSPTIVGVAIKRSLKISDESDLELLDKLQKTVLSHCAPIASTEEIIDASDEFLECNSNYHTNEDITNVNKNTIMPNTDSIPCEDDLICENENGYGCDSLNKLVWNELIAIENIADDKIDRTKIKNNLLKVDNEDGGGCIKINNKLDGGVVNRGDNVVDKQKIARSSKDINVVRHEYEVTKNINNEKCNASHSCADGVMVPSVVGYCKESIVDDVRDVELKVVTEHTQQQDESLNCENVFSVKNIVNVEGDYNSAIREIDCDIVNNVKENSPRIDHETLIKSASVSPTPVHTNSDNQKSATPSDYIKQSVCQRQ
ncbi:hypothetical protein Bhyg_17238 [Pseudolycoriella hygida]|uniref:Uncharacterized protein n=1 Tax=Pseudolycoriella hygida TaxID=35572 RepID=A0A9Q0MJ71_9DIPT|nr:hypothetical protein Bhyg_17238 [Pseudolycoriella hygida]